MTKIISLHADQPPRGRALLLAKAFASFAALEGKDCLLIASDLFGGGRTRHNPVRLEILDGVDLTEFRSVCAEFGISLEGPY